MTTPQDRLNAILPSWFELLQQWSVDGSLASTAEHVLDLDGENAIDGASSQLQGYIQQWSLEDFESIPPIVLLSDQDISGAQGAYAASTDTIYLNQDWLLTATEEQIIAVLTEELGAFLDDQLNTVDTQGDEGALFSAELLGVELSDAEVAAIQVEDDSVQISVGESDVEAEASSQILIVGTELSDELSDNPNESNLIQGLSGSDIIYGYGGQDSYYGGEGNDEIYFLLEYPSDNYIASVSSVEAFGELGDDYILINLAANALADGGGGSDRIFLNSYREGTGALWSTQYAFAIANGGLGRDTIGVSNFYNAVVDGGDDSDNISVKYVTKSDVNGGAGNDNITLDLISELSRRSMISTQNYELIESTVNGGYGDDIINARGNFYSGIFGVDGTAIFNSASVYLYGDEGSDRISVDDFRVGDLQGWFLDGTSAFNPSAGFISAFISGGTGNDSFFVRGVAKAEIETGEGSDIITISYVQYLYQQIDNIIFSDGTIKSTIIPEAVSITDFTPGAGGDVLDLSDLIQNGAVNYQDTNLFSDGYIVVEQFDQDVLISFDRDGFLGSEQVAPLAWLRNMDGSQLTADNFKPTFSPEGYLPSNFDAITVSTDQVAILISQEDNTVSDAVANIESFVTERINLNDGKGKPIWSEQTTYQAIEGGQSLDVDGIILTTSAADTIISAQGDETTGRFALQKELAIYTQNGVDIVTGSSLGTLYDLGGVSAEGDFDTVNAVSGAKDVIQLGANYDASANGAGHIVINNLQEVDGDSLLLQGDPSRYSVEPTSGSTKGNKGGGKGKKSSSLSTSFSIYSVDSLVDGTRDLIAIVNSSSFTEETDPASFIEYQATPLTSQDWLNSF